MIRKNDFQKIDFQIQTEIKKSFDKAKSESKNNDFILFLSNAEYVDYVKTLGDNPYLIDYKIDKRHDSFRLNVLMDYLNAQYSFKAENTAV